MLSSISFDSCIYPCIYHLKNIFSLWACLVLLSSKAPPSMSIEATTVWHVLTQISIFCSVKWYKWNYIFVCVCLGSFTQHKLLRFFSMLLHLSVLKLLSGILLYDCTIVYYLACYWTFGLFSVINKWGWYEHFYMRLQILSGYFRSNIVLLLKPKGCPWWFSGKESACQCKRCGFDPWMGKTP